MGKIRWLGHSAFEIHRPDVALIPIGGYYTMGDREAAEAVKLVKPPWLFPCTTKPFRFWLPQPRASLKSLGKCFQK